MPALTAFKRQWNIGSDDFVFPGISMLFVRSVWFITITSVYTSHYKHLKGCEGGLVLKLFFIGMIVMLALKAIVNVFLIYHSSRGSIKDCSSRRAVSKVLYVKLALFFLEVVWLIMGSFWAADEYENCDWIVVNTVRALAVFAWIGVIVFIVMFFLIFSPMNGDSSTLNASLIWRRRCKMLCCTYGDGDTHTSDAYTDIANLVTGFFQDVDLVPSDIAAGLLLVSREQERIEQSISSEDSRHIYGDRHQAVDITDSIGLSQAVAPWMTIHKAAHVMCYALCAYGWPFYSFNSLPFGCCVLCCTSPRVRLIKGRELHGSDLCSCNLVSIEKHLDKYKSSADIYHVSLVNKLFVTPFVIFLDHEQKAVVVAIRGTLSLKDALVDMTALGDEIHEDFPKGYKAHKGMIMTARNLAETLVNGGLLDNAFSGLCSNYDLIICGHSLGAGVAAILSMLLKAKYSRLQCFAYSPPGGLLSEEAYKASREYTMSVILGDDLVPRLSIQTMQDLKVNVMRTIHDCPHPKYQIFCSLPFRVLSCKCCSLDEDERIMQRPLVSGHDRRTSYTVEETRNESAGVREAVESRNLLRIQPPFYAPGYIMYITPSSVDERSCCAKESEYTWRWADQSEFLTLKVTPKMGAHHMPNQVMDVLNMLTPEYPEAVLIDSSQIEHHHSVEA